jgi:hypothetical protein
MQSIILYGGANQPGYAKFVLEYSVVLLWPFFKKNSAFFNAKKRNIAPK